MKSRKGFTIIELLLAMTFVAVLMITVAFLVIRITAIYQKGLTIRSINQVGRNLMSEFSRAVADSPVDDSDDSDQFFYPIAQGGTQMNGAFCTGRYSFLWNTGTAFPSVDQFGQSERPDRRIRFRNRTSTDPYIFRLLRFSDNSRAVCRGLRQMHLNNETVLNLSSVEQIRDVVPVELLSLTGTDAASATDSASESDLALYDLRVFPPTINQITGHAFYSATFILGTLRGIDISRAGDYCINMSATLNTDYALCAINKFNFAMTTTGDSGGTNDTYGNRER
jgi:type II secretory pathway pseudopilin PulG